MIVADAAMTVGTNPIGIVCLVLFPLIVTVVFAVVIEIEECRP